MDNRYSLVILAASIGVGWALMRTLHQDGQERPLSVSGADGPNVLIAGDRAEAERRAKELFMAWEASGEDWDNGIRTHKIGYRNLRLPDQGLAEFPQDREQGNTSFAIIKDRKGPHREIACFSDLYLRKNIRRFKNERNDTHPEGSYLVVWRDGRITWVPAMDVRMMPRDANPQFPECFPGQAIYRSDLKKLPWQTVAVTQR